MIRKMFFAAIAASACASAPKVERPTWKNGWDSVLVEDIKPTAEDVLVWREERFEVPLPLDDYYPRFLIGAQNLENYLPGTPKVPGVDHNEALSVDVFPAVGSRRLVCLADGNWAREEVLALDDTGFRTLVSNYSLEAARPIEYGLGEFKFERLTASSTRVTWRYSFKLRTNRFPGSLGGLGRWLFRRSFLDSDYAAFMAAGVTKMTEWAVADARR